LTLLQQTFDQDRSTILERIKNDYQEAARRESLLAAAYASQNAEVSGQGEKLIQYNILKREADSNRQLYDSMLQQLKESTIASAMRASNVRVVDPAVPPRRPYKPDIPHSAFIGLLAGIFLGAAFIVMRDRADVTIQQPGQSPIFSHAPELGIIPSAKAEAVGRALASSSHPNNIELVTLDPQPSAVSEAFRSTLVSILFTAKDDEQPQVIVLASGGPSEGKSTVASNLAIVISELGKRVLLIDADLRRPRQHDIFSIPKDRGLTNFLRERIPINGDRTLGGMIHQTKIPNLDIFPSGPTTNSATNLLYTRQMADLVKYARENYDVVLIDTPPMLQIPDARVVGRLADKVILVVRANKTSRNSMTAASQRFQQDGTHVMGTILNDWNPKKSPNGYYGYYQKYGDADYYSGKGRE
jgi:capsular exopolysaccharide synthesis family protein